MKGAGIGVDEICDTELVGEERVGLVEAIDITAIQEERRVTAKEEAATDGLAGVRGREGEIGRASGVGEGNIGDG